MQNTIGKTEASANGKDMRLAPAMKATIDHAIEGASLELHRFYEDVENLTQSVTSMTGEELSGAKTRLMARIDAAGEYLEDLGKSAMAQAQRGVEASDAYAHAKPWAMIGLGVSIGVLLGLMLKRS